VKVPPETCRTVSRYKLCGVASRWIYEYIGILLGAHPILQISRIKVNSIQFVFTLFYIVCLLLTTSAFLVRFVCFYGTSFVGLLFRCRGIVSRGMRLDGWVFLSVLAILAVYYSDWSQSVFVVMNIPLFRYG
jgi:hypothetical protein